mgnify:CR=1 FL=1
MEYWFVNEYNSWHVADKTTGELVQHEVNGKMYVTEYASEADVLAVYPEATLCKEMHDS